MKFGPIEFVLLALVLVAWLGWLAYYAQSSASCDQAGGVLVQDPGIGYDCVQRQR